MTTLIRVLATLLALTFSATIALAHDYKIGNLEISHPWAKATITGQPVGGGFMKVTNTGTEPDRLVKITSDVSDMIQIHEMKVEDGIMKMGEVPGGVEIAPGATVELKPGRLHVMFMSIKAPFKEGESFKAKLTFEKAGSIDVEFKVDSAKPGGNTNMDHKM